MKPKNERQNILSKYRKFQIEQFRSKNPKNVGSHDWIEKLFRYMKDPKLTINDVLRWVVCHRWIVAPVVLPRMQTRSISNVLSRQVPEDQTSTTTAGSQQNYNQNEIFMDASNANLDDLDVTDRILPNVVPEPEVNFDQNNQAPALKLIKQEQASILKSKRGTKRSSSNVNSDCDSDVLSKILIIGKDIAKKNDNVLTRSWVGLFDNAWRSVKNSILSKKDNYIETETDPETDYETVTIEDDEPENVQDSKSKSH